MAYSALNSPILMFCNISSVERTTTTSTTNMWYYNDADALATVQGAAYFTNAVELGMKVGDIMHVAVSGVLKTPTQYVSAVSATGATVADATA